MLKLGNITGPWQVFPQAVIKLIFRGGESGTELPFGIVKIRSYIILNGSVSARIIRVAVFPGVVIKSSSIGCVVELFEV